MKFTGNVKEHKNRKLRLGLAAVGIAALGMITPIKTAGQDSPLSSLMKNETKVASAPPKRVGDPNTPCPIEELLRGAGRQIEEYVRSLEKFSATEHVEHYSVDKTGSRKRPETRTFNYVLNINQETTGLISLEEFRNGSTDPEMFPAHVATLGLPAIDLILHPMLASDFDFHCEGLGQWEGHAMWQVHIAQRADRPARIRAYRVNRKIFSGTWRIWKGCSWSLILTPCLRSSPARKFNSKTPKQTVWPDGTATSPRPHWAERNWQESTTVKAIETSSLLTFAD